MHMLRMLISILSKVGQPCVFFQIKVAFNTYSSFDPAEDITLDMHGQAGSLENSTKQSHILNSVSL